MKRIPSKVNFHVITVKNYQNRLIKNSRGDYVKIIETEFDFRQSRRKIISPNVDIIDDRSILIFPLKGPKEGKKRPFGNLLSPLPRNHVSFRPR